MKTEHASGLVSTTKASMADSQSSIGRFKHCDMLFLFAITAVTISMIKIVQLNAPLSVNWFITPGILVLAAVVPRIIKREKLPNIDFSSMQIKRSFVVLGWTCLLVFPAMFCGLWLLKFYGFNFPLQPVLPQDQQLASWLLYQFMYVSVAEEVFFRGFLQSSVQRYLAAAIPKRRLLQCCLSVIISAVCFAAAHMIMQESVLSILIIIPGLIMGWLYIKTNSLLAPILFHGIANAGYYLMVEAII